MENVTFTLNNGVKMPAAGLGVFQVTDRKQCIDAVICAIENGYRMIDTAAVYGNEEAVGEAVRLCGVPREQLFVTSKLWFSDCGYGRAKRALESSLKKLGLDYIDLYLIHEPYGWLKQTWRALEECVDEGKVRAIGVSNFGINDLINIMDDARIKPAVDQIELHPFYQRRELLGFLREKDILPEAWAPFAEGKHGIFQSPILGEIAEVHGCTAAQVILAWLHAQGVAVIPKSVRPGRIAENGGFFRVKLSESEIAEIDRMDRGASLFPWDKGIRRPLRKLAGFFHLAF